MPRFGKHWLRVALKAFYSFPFPIFLASLPTVYLYAFLSSCWLCRTFGDWAEASADMTGGRKGDFTWSSSHTLRPWGVLHRTSWCDYSIEESSTCVCFQVSDLSRVFIFIYKKEFYTIVLGLSIGNRLVFAVLIAFPLLFKAHFRTLLTFQVSCLYYLFIFSVNCTCYLLNLPVTL